MALTTRRYGAGITSVAIAAGVNVTTGMLTQHWTVAWLAATAALVLVGGGLHVLLNDVSFVTQRIKRTEVGGSVRQRAAGVGEQSVTASRVDKDLDQSQGFDRDGA